MSVKDERFGADCPICGDYLPGSDDAPMVWDGVKLSADAGFDAACDLCGEECPLAQAKAIIAKGRPDTAALQRSA